MTSRPTPRVLRLGVAAVALVVLLAACMSAEQSSALNLINRDRNAHGIRSVRGSEMLAAKAQKWANYLASINTLKHSSLSSGVSGCWRSLGENVGYGGSISGVESAFLKSSTHKANILNKNYDYAGTGVAWRGSRVFVVQVFMDAC